MMGEDEGSVDKRDSVSMPEGVPSDLLPCYAGQCPVYPSKDVMAPLSSARKALGLTSGHPSRRVTCLDNGRMD